MSQPMLSLDSRILVAGHRGLVGSAVWNELESQGYANLVGFTSAEVDLRDATATRDMMKTVQPEVVVMAAARVGGILANSTYPVDFIIDNLSIQTNLLIAAHEVDAARLLFLGSSCIYPKYAPQPIAESALLTGALEATNEPYAVAKIAGLVAVRAFRKQYGRAWISAMPTNLYGPGDNFDLQTSHVLPALIRRMHDAKVRGDPAVTLLGTGRPRREFLHSSDLARALVFLLKKYDGDSPVNIGTGRDLTIAQLADIVKRVVQYPGVVLWDTTQPDGTPRKMLDVSVLDGFGWRPHVALEDGVRSTYDWFLSSSEAQHSRESVKVTPGQPDSDG